MRAVRKRSENQSRWLTLRRSLFWKSIIHRLPTFQKLQHSQLGLYTVKIPIYIYTVMDDHFALFAFCCLAVLTSS